MSLAGIASTSYFNQLSQSPSLASKNQKIQQEFQQLGQDLQSGNTSAAQSDYASLQKMVPALNSSTPQSYDPRVSDFNQLGQDLQAGNTTAAQQDYAKLQQDFQHQGHVHHNHRFHVNDSSTSSDSASQLFQQLGQELQSGNISAAQQAYTSLLADLPQISQSTSATTPAAVSVSA